MIDISQISDKLILSKDGIWTPTAHIDLSFLSEETIDWFQVEEHSFWYYHRNRCFIEIIRHFPPNGVLFEIGAGNGSVSLYLQEQGIPIVAIEPTVKMAVKAKQRGVNHVVCATLDSAKIKDHVLDNVGMFDVLEHILNDESLLIHVRRTMRSGGRFYCSVPSYTFLWSLEDEAAGHIRRYRLASLCKKISRCEFQIEYSSYYFVPLVLPIFVIRSIPSLFGLRSQRTHQSTIREHQIPSGLVGAFLKRALEWERKCLSRGRRHYFGASCIAVARAI